MSLFDVIPYDILHLIAEDYLGGDVETLSCLDVACCNRAARPELLALLSTVHAAPSPVVNELANFIVWIAARRIQIAMLHVNVESLTDFAGVVLEANIEADLPPAAIVTVDGIALNGNDEDLDGASLPVFLSHFPNLTSIDCSEWASITNLQVTALSCCGQLKRLNLSNNDSLTAGAIAWLVCFKGGTLQELSCDVLDDDALGRVAKHCHRISHLRLSCVECISSENLELLCIANAGQLETLVVVEEGYFDILDAVRNITVVCKKIKRLLLCENNRNRNEDWSFIGSVLQQLDQLEEFVLGATSLQLHCKM